MEGLPEITIACEGSFTVDLNELKDLQGNLKDLTETNYVKLRNAIVAFGFSFPIFVWEEGDTKWILDAHQRTRTLRKMQQEGYTIPQLPAVRIFATNRTEAKKKLLLLNSKYGKITREGFDEFVDEPDYQISEDMEDYLSFPELEMWDGNKTTEQQETDDATANPDKIREITCPNCQHKFTLFDNK